MAAMPRSNKGTQRFIDAAYKKAESLGLLVSVAPASRHSVDGSPLAGSGGAAREGEYLRRRVTSLGKGEALNPTTVQQRE